MWEDNFVVAPMCILHHRRFFAAYFVRQFDRVCERADPAADLAAAVDFGFLRALDALDATRHDVCLRFLDMSYSLSMRVRLG